MRTNSNKVLIVGQGIAGTALAWQCIKQGLEFKIIDDGHKSSSSLAAAGLFNPLILKRRRLTWGAEDFMKELSEFYGFIQKELDTKIVHKTGMWRRMSSIEEMNDWQSLKGNPAYASYLGETIEGVGLCNGISAPFGYQEVKEVGFVEVDQYLERSKEYFKANGMLERDTIDLDSPIENLTYRGQEFKKILFAIGFRAMKDSYYFSSLPFTPAKGHTIEVKCESLDLKHPVNGPCFIIPLGDSRFRIGSTYSWDNFNNLVEDSEIDKLRKSFESMCDLPYTIELKWAGVRPATSDRKPLIGASLKDPNVMIFNGLGSRAIMTTPLLSAMTMNHIVKGEDLRHDVSLSRFSA